MAEGRRFWGVCGFTLHSASTGRPQSSGPDRGRPAWTSTGPHRAGRHQEVDRSSPPAPETEPEPAGGARPQALQHPRWVLNASGGGRVEL